LLSELLHDIDTVLSAAKVSFETFVVLQLSLDGGNRVTMVLRGDDFQVISSPLDEGSSLTPETRGEGFNALLAFNLLADPVHTSSLLVTEDAPLAVDGSGAEVLRGSIRRTVVDAELSLESVVGSLDGELLVGLAGLHGLLVVIERCVLSFDTFQSVIIITVIERTAVAIDPVNEGLSLGEVIRLELIIALLEGDDLSEATTGDLNASLGGEALEVLRQISNDGALIRTSNVNDIINIKESGDTELLLSDVESELEVVTRVFLRELAVVQQIGTVTVNQSAEAETAGPRGSEVGNFDIFVSGSLSLAPKEKTLLSGEFIDANTLNLEIKNDCPDHTKKHLLVAVDQMDGLQEVGLDTSSIEHSEGKFDVVELVGSHLGGLVVLGHFNAVERVQQLHELNTSLPIILDVVDGFSATELLDDVSIAPFGESLLLDLFPSFFFCHDKYD